MSGAADSQHSAEQPSAEAKLLGSWQQALRGQVPALDGVRGLAILAVLAHQLLVDYPDESVWLRRALAIPQAGWLGVQLFFVLSGFLITGILLETRQAENRWQSFFIRRFLRIFPPYYLVLCVLFWIVPRLMALPSDVSDSFQHQSWYWFYLANWSLVAGGGVAVLGHCWSLSVEEQFYVLWPPLVFTVRPRTLAWACGGAVVIAFAARLWIVVTGKNPEYAYELTPCRMDALAIGAITALLARNARALPMLLGIRRLANVLIILALVATAVLSGVLSRRNPVTLTLGHSVLAIASGWLILLAVRDHVRRDGHVGRVLAWAPIRLYGKHSYAIYLFHHPLDIAANRLFLRNALAGVSRPMYVVAQASYTILGSVLLLGIAILFHRLFERPLLGLKRYFVARTKDVSPGLGR